MERQGSIKMRGSMRFSALLLSCFVTLSGEAAFAQSGTGRTTRETVLLEQPRGDSRVIQTVSPGLVLQVLRQQGEWFRIVGPDVVGRTAAVGWVHRAAFELLQAAPPQAPAAAPGPTYGSAPAPSPAGPLSGIELELRSKKAHVVNNSTDQKVFDELLKQLREWKRWEVVGAKDEANVLIVFSDRVTNRGLVGSFAGGTGTIVPVISDQRFLVLVDPATNENILTISCERRLRASYTAGVLVNRLRDRIVKDERNRKP